MTPEEAEASKPFPAATAIAASLMFCAGIVWLVVAPSKDNSPAMLDPVPAGSGARPQARSEETQFSELQRELRAGREGDAGKILSGMIVRHPDSSYTVRGFTLVRARLDGADDLTGLVLAYQKKYLTLAPAVYDALLRPRKLLIDRRGMLDPAALGTTPEQITESLLLCLEQGYLEREQARSGQKFLFDSATTMFSSVIRVAPPQSEPWWICKYEVLATLFERGAEADIKLARVGLENIERAHPEFDQDKYHLKGRFLKLKQQIAELLKPK